MEYLEKCYFKINLNKMVDVAPYFNRAVAREYVMRAAYFKKLLELQLF